MQNKNPWSGRFIWHDLMTTDGARSQQFYGSLFDWQIQEIPMPGMIYRMVTCGPGPIGGIVEEKRVPRSNWLPYIGVDDVDATAKKVQQLGGRLHVPPTDIPGTGRFALCIDPVGAYFSIYKGLPQSPGFDPDLPVPGRICWNETYSTDDDAAQKFYTAVFGWQPQTKDMGPAGIYRIQMLGDKQAGGLMKQPMPGMPSCWVCYFLVVDLAASTDKAKQLGANAMMESVPIPDVGRFSMFTDPTGAMFALFEPAMPPAPK